jgi:branched-chain amino acid transport system substrate-binding protein
VKLRRSVVFPVLSAAAALALAACASSASPAPKPAGGSPATQASAAASGGTGSTPISDFAGYVGGSGKASSSLAPIEIGVTNQQGGSADTAPEWTIGAQLAADLINNQAGGIDGHPLKLVTCAIPDQVSNAAQCGQQFANDSNIQAVAVGAVAIGNQALESALAPTGKPAFFGIAISPVDTTYKNGYILFGDTTHVEAPLATFIKQNLHAKSVAIIYPNIPGANIDAEITQDALEYEHVPVKVVGFDPNTTNLTGPVIASGAATAGVVLNDSPTPPICSDIYKALKQLNITTPVLANVPCDSAIAAQGDGGQLPSGWYYASAKSLPGDPADPVLKAFTTVANQYGQSKYASDNWVADAFVQVLTIAKMDAELLKAGKPVTAANISAQFKAFSGPVPMGAPDLVCGSFATAPAVCNDKVSFFQNTAPGVFKAVVRWIGPPDGFQIPAGLQ